MYLRQATAAQSRATHPFVDDTDFKTLKTALTIANTDVQIVMNGGATANKNAGGGTHRANGIYGLTFDATDTATVGEMDVSIKVAGALVVFMKFWVIEEAVYDAMFGAGATGPLQSGGTVGAVTNDVGITQAGADKVWSSATRTLTVSAGITAADVWAYATRSLTDVSNIVNGGPITTGSGYVLNVGTVATVGVSAISNTSFANGAITNTAFAAGAINATAIGSNAIDASKIANGAIDAATFAAGAFDAVWSTATRVLTAGTNIVLAKGTGITGFNDIAATAIVSGGAITTSGGAVSVVSTVNALAANSVNAAAVANGALDAAAFAAGAFDAVWTVTTRTLTSSGSGGATAAEVWGYATRSLTDVSNIVNGGPVLTSGGTVYVNVGSQQSIASYVWEALLADHTNSGTTGEAIGAAGASGDPWSTVLPGAYAPGTAGHRLGTGVPDVAAGATGGLALVGSNMGSVASVTADVGITQVAADKVWNTTTRTLTSSGFVFTQDDADKVWLSTTRTLTASLDPSAATIATAVWGNATRTLTAGAYSFAQADADKVWASATRILTAGTNIVLAKGVGLTGLNDIAATQIVSGGAITTAGGAVSVVSTVNALAANSVNAAAIADGAIDAATFAAGALNAVWVATTRTLTASLDPTALQIATAVWQDSIVGDFTAVGSIGKSLGGAFTSLGASVYTTAALANAPSGGSGGATAGEIAAVVWDTVLAGHLTPGTTGAALNAAGAGGDPWSISLPGSYPPGTAGHRVGLGVPDVLAGATGGLALVGSNMGTVASVTADVGITQAGADKVWLTTSRTLTAGSFTFTQGDADKVWLSAARTLTSGANIVLAKGIGLIGLSDIAAGDVWDVAMSGHQNAGSAGEALVTAASGGDVPTVDEIADAVWDEDASAHNVPGSTGQALSIVVRSAVAVVNDNNANVLSFKTTLPSTVNDFYVDHTLIFTTGLLVSVARRIIGYQGSQRKVTLDEALTIAPADGERFDIWPASAMLEAANLVWDEAVTGASHTIPGTSGFLVGAYLNVPVSSRAAPGDAMNLTPAYDAAKTAAAPGAAMTLTPAYDKAKTAAQPGDQMSLSPAATAALIAALDASVIEGTITRIQADRIMFAAIGAGRTDGAGTTSFHVKSLDGVKNRIAAQTDLLGNRLSVALNGS